MHPNDIVDVKIVGGKPRLTIGNRDWKFDSNDVTQLRAVAHAINEEHRREMGALAARTQPYVF